MKYGIIMFALVGSLHAQEKKSIGIYQCCNNLSENIHLEISEHGKNKKKMTINAKQKQLFFFTPSFKISVLKEDKTVIASMTIDDYRNNVINIQLQEDQPVIYLQQKIDEQYPLLASCAQNVSEPNTPREVGKKRTKQECCHCPQQ